MNEPNRTKAVAMLVIMLMMIGHDSVPHVHDPDHPEFNHYYVVDPDSNESEWDRLFEVHTRTNHSHKYTHTSEPLTLVKRQITSAFLLPDLGIFHSSDVDFSPCTQFSRAGTIKLYFHSNGLRAPPFCNDFFPAKDRYEKENSI